jgi:hypothetical protein
MLIIDVTKHSYTHNKVKEVDPVHAMKVYGEVEVQLHSLLTLAQDGSELHAPDDLPMGTVSTDERLGWPQSWSGCFQEKEKFLVPARYQTTIPWLLCSSLIDCQAW